MKYGARGARRRVDMSRSTGYRRHLIGGILSSAHRVACRSRSAANVCGSWHLARKCGALAQLDCEMVPVR